MSDRLLLLGTIFNTFAILGPILIAATLAPPLFSSRVHRRPAWFIQIGSWLLYSVSYILLIGQQDGPEPRYGLCVFQAALIYASPPLAVLSLTCFVIDFFCELRAICESRRLHAQLRNFISIAPCIIYIVVFFVNFILIDSPTDVKREPSGFYCHMTGGTSSLISAIVVVLACAILFIFEGWIVYVFYRNWGTYRRLAHSIDKPSFSIFVRMLLFTTMPVCAAILGAFIIPNANYSIPEWSALLPIPPTIAAIAFGTQSDIIGTYLCWERDEPTAEHRPLPSEAPTSPMSPALTNPAPLIVLTPPPPRIMTPIPTYEMR